MDAGQISEEDAAMLLDGLTPHPDGPAEDGAPAPHPEVAALVARFAAAGVPTYDALGVAAARELLEGVVRLQKPRQAVASVADLIADGGEHPVPVRVYRPQADGPLPTVVYLHGGGWVLGSLDAADEPCRALANAGPCVVVSVEYRRAPEVRFPVPLQDCVTAVRWAARDVAALGGSSRLVLLGDSAGGNLAAATALVLRDEGDASVAAQVLLYPALAPSSTTDFASYRAFADGPLMTRRELDWFWGLYLRGDHDVREPTAAPLHAPDLSGLPEATVVVPQLDPLHDEGVAYAERLRAAGVPVRLLEVPGAAHGFWWMSRALSAADELTAELGPVVTGAG